MIDLILSALKAQGIAAYVINEHTRESAERFFIRQREDIRRAKHVREVEITVYRDFESDGKAMRGSSTVKLQPSMTEEEIARKLAGAYESALYVKNPFFELPDPVCETLAPEGPLAAMTLDDAADAMAEALFAPDRMDDAFINSAEIFATRQDTRTITSRGTDVRYSAFRVKGEFVVQCVRPTDVEMYHSFEYAAPDTLALSDLSLDALTTVRDRALADAAPEAGAYDVILTKKHVCTLLSAYVDKAAADMVYAKYSPYAVGTHAQGDAVTGEALNLSVFPDAPFSSDGIRMTERPLLENGVVKGIYGATRFCRYLNLEPSGVYENIRVNNGTLSLEELKNRRCLMPVAFSDFQMDSMSGRFGGEIRLAYLFDDEGGVQLVTGGSISGSLLEKQDRLTFSTERYTNSHYDGPAAVLIPGVSVAGC